MRDGRPVEVNSSLYAVAGGFSMEVILAGAAEEYLAAKERIFNVRRT